MYTVLIAAAVAVVFIIWRWIKRNREDSFGFYVQTVLCAIAAIIAVFVTSGNVDGHIPSVNREIGEWNLVAMRSSDGVSGSFVWGTGTIGGAIVYTVYIKNGDGSMTPWRIYADANTRIIEDASLQNKGTWRRTELVRDETSPLTKWAPISYRRGIYDTITVPVGTVVQSFSVK